jgi:hypothetical protein
MRNWLAQGVARWRDARIAKVALGKYIILFACLLHLGWAIMLCISPSAAGSTPVHILSQVFGGPYRTAAVLLLVTAPALVFPFIRQRVSNQAMGLMLIPQQATLVMSAGAGAYAAMVGHYADGVLRPWPFILSDQLPVILTAVLYTVAVIEASLE